MEKRTLVISIIVASFFAMLGIIGGVYSNSDMIVFDGVYSFISVGLTFLSLKIIEQLDDYDDSNYPFGKAHFEPLIVVYNLAIFFLISLY